MTAHEQRRNVVDAWHRYHEIHQRPRAGGDREPCRVPPSQWDWQTYVYEDAGPSPVCDLMEEYKQATRDGEAIILSHAAAGRLVAWITSLRCHG